MFAGGSRGRDLLAGELLGRCTAPHPAKSRCERGGIGGYASRHLPVCHTGDFFFFFRIVNSSNAIHESVEQCAPDRFVESCVSADPLIGTFDRLEQCF